MSRQSSLGPSASIRILTALALLSGCCGLAYEVLYLRALTTLLGDMLYVHAALLSTFLIGIALGAKLASHWVRWLWLLEILTGVYAMTLPALCRWLTAQPFLATVSSSPSLTILATIALLSIPSLLIGFSIPLFSAYIKRIAEGKLAFQGIYMAYNLGALSSVLAVELFMVRHLGIARSLAAIGAINVFNGVVLLWMRAAPDREPALRAPPLRRARDRGAGARQRGQRGVPDVLPQADLHGVRPAPRELRGVAVARAPGDLRRRVDRLAGAGAVRDVPAPGAAGARSDLRGLRAAPRLERGDPRLGHGFGTAVAGPQVLHRLAVRVAADDPVRRHAAGADAHRAGGRRRIRAPVVGHESRQRRRLPSLRPGRASAADQRPVAGGDRRAGARRQLPGLGVPLLAAAVGHRRSRRRRVARDDRDLAGEELLPGPVVRRSLRHGNRDHLQERRRERHADRGLPRRRVDHLQRSAQHLREGRRGGAGPPRSSAA